MTEEKPTRRELLRPLHLLGIALACGVFAAGVTFVSTGAFTARVNLAIANGNYEGLTPVALGLVVGGGAFIATLLLLSMLILAVDPVQFAKPMDRPVLYDPETADDADAASGDAGHGAADAADAARPGQSPAPAADDTTGAERGEDEDPSKS